MPQQVINLINDLIGLSHKKSPLLKGAFKPLTYHMKNYSAHLYGFAAFKFHALKNYFTT